MENISTRANIGNSNIKAKIHKKKRSRQILESRGNLLDMSTGFKSRLSLVRGDMWVSDKEASPTQKITVIL